MVREQEPARTPLSPSKGNAIHQPAAAVTKPTQEQNAFTQPLFGQPTQLNSPLKPQYGSQPSQNSNANTSAPRQPSQQPKSDKYSHMFIGNKGNSQHLHKPTNSSNPFYALKDRVEQKVEQKVQNLLDKRQEKREDAAASMAYPNLPPQQRDDDVFIISDPMATKATSIQTSHPARWQNNGFGGGNLIAPGGTTAYQAQPTTFSSNPTQSAFFQSGSNMAVGHFGMATNNSMFQDEYSASDPLMYMDSAKANESIKNLLEGAFEDEDDKPRTRRKQKLQEKKADELTSAMQNMKVKEEEPEDDQEDDDDGSREGLKVKLLPHQIDGVSWMVDKETGTKKTKGVFPKGGILADDMGLGKTMQSLALILANPKPSDAELEHNKKSKLTPGLDKGTLVVAPLALIKQWEAEIKDRIHSSHALKVCVHHGPKRTKYFKDLKKYDVVITTYQTLASEHDESGGTLKVGCFGVKWYRVILDEAHSIKNRNAKATKAACGLDAEYRWCLTGTPMQNNLDELQSLIHFLRIKPYEDLNVWREQITKPMNNGKGGLAIKRLRAYLQAFMKRRTKDVLKQDGGLNPGKGIPGKAQSNGFRIVHRHVESVVADFSPQEREFYSRLESRTDKSLEQMMMGNKMSYASALVLLMRLRQACNHPKLTGNDLSAEKDNISGVGTGAATPSRNRKLAADDMDSIADMLAGLSVDMKKCDMCQIELSKEETRDGRLRCVECEADLKAQEMPMVKIKKERKVKKQQHKKVSKVKPLKEKRRKQARRIVDSDDEGDNDYDDDDLPSITDLTSSQPKAYHNTSTSDDEDEDEDDEQPSSEESEDDNIYGSSSDESEVSLIASTKIRTLLNLLSPSALKSGKFIIFSFFTSMLDLISPFLHQSGIRHVKYYGSMPNHLREASLASLRTDDNVRVLLCSLRAGSLGLNLTAASRVVILEPFWNPFVEEQAIDRVHRLNQTQDVKVFKITVRDTVEERILELQDKKRELARATIEGVKGGNMKLTLQDMLKLFRHDAEGDKELDMLGMKEEGNLLSRDRGERIDRGERLDRGLDGEEERRRLDGARERERLKERRKEHEVYGRRW